VAAGGDAATPAPPGPAAGALAGAAYGMLALLGLALGVVGAFHHSWYLGDVPVAALGWLVVLFAVPYAMGRLNRGKIAAAVPAVGWFIATFALATKHRAGDFVIAADLAGYLYLYGGAVVMALAVALAPSSGSWLLRAGRS